MPRSTQFDDGEGSDHHQFFRISNANKQSSTRKAYLAMEISTKAVDGVLVITMNDGSTIIKTPDEMEKESPGFRGIVTQTNLLNNTDGSPIDQTSIKGWIFSRGFLAECLFEGKQLRQFGDTMSEAYQAMRARTNNAKVAG